MTHLLTQSQQNEVLDILWYLIQETEERCIKSKSLKNKQLVTDTYNVLNRIGFTTERPDWETPEDPRQTKFKF